MPLPTVACGGASTRPRPADPATPHGAPASAPGRRGGGGRRRPRPVSSLLLLTAAAAVAATASAFVPPVGGGGGQQPWQHQRQHPQDPTGQQQLQQQHQGQAQRVSTTRLQSSTLPRRPLLQPFPVPPPIITPPPLRPPGQEAEGAEHEEAALRAVETKEGARRRKKKTGGEEEEDSGAVGDGAAASSGSPAAIPPLPMASSPAAAASHPDQLQAAVITSSARYSLLVAGAGTGKTRVLAARIAHLVQTGKARPDEILVLSFTNAAARAIQSRANALLTAGRQRERGEQAEDEEDEDGEEPVSEWEAMNQEEGDEDGDDALLTAGTFHGLAASIIRRHAYLALGGPLKVVGHAQQVAAMRRAMQAEFGVPLSPAARGFRAGGGGGPGGATTTSKSDDRFLDAEAEDMLRFISLWKSSGALPEDLHPSLCATKEEARACRLYPAYQRELQAQQAGALDFDDLVMVALDLLLEYPDILRSYQRRFRHILVDEFQDTNEAQYALLRALALGAAPPEPDEDLEERLKDCPHVMCAGDDDQSIYSFRGARAGRAFAAFLADFPHAVAVGLPISYRLPGHIYVAAQEVIGRNNAPPLFPPSAPGPDAAESMLDYYSSAATAATSASAAVNGSSLPPIPPRNYMPRLPPGVGLDTIADATLSRISVQEVWDDADEARWIARRVRELYLSFGSGSFTWDERAALFNASPYAGPASEAPAGATGDAAATATGTETEVEQQAAAAPSSAEQPQQPQPPASQAVASSSSHHHLAILVRSGWQLRVLEEALIRQRLPYVVQGGASLLASKEARAAMGLLGALLHESPREASEGQDDRDRLLEKAGVALGYPRRALRAVLAAARRDGVSVEEAAAWAVVDGHSLMPGAGLSSIPVIDSSLPALLAAIPRWRAFLRAEYGKGGAGGRKALRLVLEEAGLLPPPPAPPASGESAAEAAAANNKGRKKKGGAGGERFANDLDRAVALVAEAFEELPQLGAWCAAMRTNHLTPAAATKQQQAQQSAAAAAQADDGNSRSGSSQSQSQSHYQQLQQRKVVLSTMHGAKGQEFDLVFLAGWDEGVFPLLPRGQRRAGAGKGKASAAAAAAVASPVDALSSGGAGDEELLDEATATLLAEERRLAYVALTRARLNAFITFTHRRRLPGGAWATTTPSRFIAELPRRLVRLGLLGPRVMNRAPKPTNDLDFRRIRPNGVKTRQDGLLLDQAPPKVNPLRLPVKPPQQSPPPPAEAYMTAAVPMAPSPLPPVPASFPPPDAADAAVVGAEAPMPAPAATVIEPPQLQLQQKEERAAPAASARERKHRTEKEQGDSMGSSGNDDDSGDRPLSLLVVDPSLAARLPPMAVQQAAQAMATTAAIAKGLALATGSDDDEEGGGGSSSTTTAAGRRQRRRRQQRAAAMLQKALPASTRETGAGKKKSSSSYEVVPGLLALLEDDGIAVSKRLRPFYRAALQATGRRLANLPAREDPARRTPLSQCPTQHLGLLAVAHLVTDGALVRQEGWGALRRLFRRLLARYGIGSGSAGSASVRVPVQRHGKAELRPLAQCSGAQLGDLLLALLAQEDGAMEVVGGGEKKQKNDRKRGGSKAGARASSSGRSSSKKQQQDDDDEQEEEDF